MLIASLPPVHQEELLEEIITNPGVGAVRYNTGMSSAYEPRETLQRIMRIAVPLAKPVYVDLKGKQLRVVEWANLPEGPIVLNHRIEAKKPAKVFFRGDDCRALGARCTPVVTNDHCSVITAEHVVQCICVSGQRRSLVCAILRHRSRRISAHKRRNGVKPCFGKRRQEMAPGMCRIWKPVHAQCQRTGTALKCDKVDAVCRRTNLTRPRCRCL